MCKSGAYVEDEKQKKFQSFIKSNTLYAKAFHVDSISTALLINFCFNTSLIIKWKDVCHIT